MVKPKSGFFSIISRFFSSLTSKNKEVNNDLLPSLSAVVEPKVTLRVKAPLVCLSYSSKNSRNSLVKYKT